MKSLRRSVDTWEKCDPTAMSRQSTAAAAFAFEDMRHDILLLAAQRDELLESLKGMTRIVEAFSRSNMLGKSQGDRMRGAQELIKKIEGAQ